jgi:hypothetical protein
MALGMRTRPAASMAFFMSLFYHFAAIERRSLEGGAGDG